MKAVLCKAFGPPESLVIEEIEPLKAGKGQVVISVKACGVNFPDTLIIQGKYQSKPPFPFIPGSEVAGVVKDHSAAGIAPIAAPGEAIQNAFRPPTIRRLHEINYATTISRNAALQAPVIGCAI